MTANGCSLGRGAPGREGREGMSNQTGWFGVPGEMSPRYPTVHFVRDGRPICGVRPRREAEFQFCAHGFKLSLVECERCRKAAEEAR